MKPERIEYLMSLTPDQMVEEATDAELLHLLRCARAVAELETRLREDGRCCAQVLTSDDSMSCEIFVAHETIAEAKGPDLLTATEAALEKAKDA